MTSTSGKKHDGPSIRDERIERLAELDERLLDILGERAALLDRESEWRRARGKGAVDPALEKALWKRFEARARKAGLDRRVAKQLFGILNLCALEEASPRAVRDTAYILAPRRQPVAVDIPGPPSRSLARTRIALAAAANLDLHLNPVVLNDPLLELVKALNQAGAHLSWATGEVRNESGRGHGPSFEGKTIFAGDHPDTFHLIVALALAHAGRVKFTGGPGLKLADMALLNVVLPRLGARLVPLNPHSHGLPARLECGGEMEPRVELPAETPPSFAASLALAAWSYPQGLRLVLPEDEALRRAVEDAVWTLNASGIEARLEGDECAVPPGVPSPSPANGEDTPESATILDPILSAYLLALPALADGRVELAGRFHADDPVAAFVLERLDTLGLDLDVRPGSVAAKAYKLPEQEIRIGRVPELYPLALAMSLRAKRPMLVRPPADETWAGLGEEFLERLGVTFEARSEGLMVSPSELSWEAPWTCPNPYFVLGLALASVVRPGLALDNPGILTGLWPQFFGIFNALPGGRAGHKAEDGLDDTTLRPDDAKDNHDRPKRRRIRS